MEQTLQRTVLSRDEGLAQVCFKNTAFLEQNGLSEHSVMDYFATSQFYDPTSINEQFHMQQRFNPSLQGSRPQGVGQGTTLDRRKMKGLEFELWYFTHQPSLYVIRRQLRSSPTKGICLLT